MDILLELQSRLPIDDQIELSRADHHIPIDANRVKEYDLQGGRRCDKYKSVQLCVDQSTVDDFIINLILSNQIRPYLNQGNIYRVAKLSLRYNSKLFPQLISNDLINQVAANHDLTLLAQILIRLPVDLDSLFIALVNNDYKQGLKLLLRVSQNHSYGQTIDQLDPFKLLTNFQLLDQYVFEPADIDEETQNKYNYKLVEAALTLNDLAFLTDFGERLENLMLFLDLLVKKGSLDAFEIFYGLGAENPLEDYRIIADLVTGGRLDLLQFIYNQALIRGEDEEQIQVLDDEGINAAIEAKNLEMINFFLERGVTINGSTAGLALTVDRTIYDYLITRFIPDAQDYQWLAESAAKIGDLDLLKEFFSKTYYQNAEHYFRIMELGIAHPNIIAYVLSLNFPPGPQHYQMVATKGTFDSFKLMIEKERLFQGKLDFNVQRLILPGLIISNNPDGVKMLELLNSIEPLKNVTTVDLNQTIQYNNIPLFRFLIGLNHKFDDNGKRVPFDQFERGTRIIDTLAVAFQFDAPLEVFEILIQKLLRTIREYEQLIVSYLIDYDRVDLLKYLIDRDLIKKEAFIVFVSKLQADRPQVVNYLLEHYFDSLDRATIGNLMIFNKINRSGLRRILKYYSDDREIIYSVLHRASQQSFVDILIDLKDQINSYSDQLKVSYVLMPAVNNWTDLKVLEFILPLISDSFLLEGTLDLVPPAGRALISDRIYQLKVLLL